jgi:NAD(P)-dependent dehydrogenase (short-subunit alcohol dehydrogenase family)
MVADLLSEESIRQLVDDLPELDGIVHCAGIVKPNPFIFLEREELDLVMNTNFTGPVLLTTYLIRKKIIKKNASIVFISSISGNLISYVGGSAYNASKSAINGIIKGMALDLATKGIRVNSVMPGMIETGILKEGIIDEEYLNADRKRYPLGRYADGRGCICDSIFIV